MWVMLGSGVFVSTVDYLNVVVLLGIFCSLLRLALL